MLSWWGYGLLIVCPPLLGVRVEWSDREEWVTSGIQNKYLTNTSDCLMFAHPREAVCAPHLGYVNTSEWDRVWNRSEWKVNRNFVTIPPFMFQSECSIERSAPFEEELPGHLYTVNLFHHCFYFAQERGPTTSLQRMVIALSLFPNAGYKRQDIRRLHYACTVF